MKTNNNFLAVAVDELLTYRTPKRVVEIVKKERAKLIIINPPFKSKKC